MAEQIIPVDVEKIMEEIRQEIKEKGYNDSMLSFRDVDGSEQLKELTSDVFDLGEMERVVQQMNMRSHVEWYHPVEGSRFREFLQKGDPQTLPLYADTDRGSSERVQFVGGAEHEPGAVLYQGAAEDYCKSGRENQGTGR